MSASETLAQYSPLVLNGEGMVLPELKDIQKVSRAIAFAVGKMAQQQGVAVKTSAEKPCNRPLTIISGKRIPRLPPYLHLSLRPVVKATGLFPSPFFRSHPYWVVANKSHLPHLLCRTSSEKEERRRHRLLRRIIMLTLRIKHYAH